ncbi:MAG: helix-turn-helix domain-containing protein [archaeon]|nr:helix-turn-helix domain-containing protein [archaeon]MCP8314502.1 helix-turn-helix domain-containing protein [archaeon]
MPSRDIDLLLDILGNETRRRIIKLIAEEPRYLLQMARELEVSQQAILKHLDLLQQHGLISMFSAESEFAAPQRKYYELARSLYLRVGITRNTVRFSIDKVPYKKRELKIKISDVKGLEDKVRAFEKLRKPDEALKISEEILREIDAKFEELGEMEVYLMRLKQRVSEKAKRTIKIVTSNPLERKILFSILESGKALDIDALSEELNISEKDLEMVLETLKQKGLIELGKLPVDIRNE